MKNLFNYQHITLIAICLQVNISFSQEIEIYNVPIESKQLRFSEIIEQVEIIGLEETNQTLLSYLDFYLPLEKGFILGSKDDKKFYFFDQTGEFLNLIEDSQSGEKVFSGFSSAWLKGNHLEFFGNTDRKLFRYDLKGNFLESTTINLDKDIRLGEMNPWKDGYVVTTIENLSVEDGGMVASPAGHSIIYLDSKLNTINYGHKDNTLPPFPMANVPRLHIDGGKLLYKEILNDTVFIVNDSGVDPYMKFDFGKEWAWNYSKHTVHLGAAFATINRGQFVNDFRPLFSSDFVFLKYLINAKTYRFGVVSRKTKEFINVRDNIKEIGFEPLAVFEDKLLVSLQSYSLEEFLKRIDSDKIQIRGDRAIDQLQGSENPILLLLSFKEN